MNDFVLSSRKFEVLRCAASGLSNAQISHRLALSEKTIKNHMSAIFCHYGVASRIGVIVKAIQDGHLDVSTITVAQ